MNKYDLINALSSAEEDEVFIDIDGTLYEIDEELGHQPETFDEFDTAYPALIYLKPIDGELNKKRKHKQLIITTMNENLNLIELLKDCPIGTKLYSSVHGEVELEEVHLISKPDYPIEVRLSNNSLDSFTPDGRLFGEYNGECMLFPSREQRDWSKFKVKKPKKSKFDPRTLQPFDRVLVRDSSQHWCCDLFSHIVKKEATYHYLCVGSALEYCIPYNDDTKHLVGTTDEAPEYYRYWED